MSSDSETTDYSRRNGFARRADLDDESLQELRRHCESEDAALGGSGRLDWSRQWEYPYVLANLPEDGARARILDAGSGFRFFTFLLAKRGFDVHACDLDASIDAQITEAASRMGVAVQFTTQDLSSMDYPDGWFDYVVCVSVLEHTQDPSAVVKDMCRILKPGGHLVVTFDVSLDGDRDIPIENAKSLLETMDSRFDMVHSFDDKRLMNEPALKASEDILTTRWFREHAPKLLPWRIISKSTLRNMLRGRFGRPFFNLAVMGMVLRKNKDTP